MKDYNTVFPQEIDDSIFFNGMVTSDEQVSNEYQQFLKNKQYDKASERLEDSESDYYGAYLYNLYNRRLRAIEEYIITKKKPDQVQYGDELTNIKVGTTWVSDADITNAVFIGATETQDGVSGLVVAPKAGQENDYLRGSGSFETVKFADYNDEPEDSSSGSIWIS